MKNNIYKLIIAVLLVAVVVMGFKIKDLKEISQQHQENSIDQSIECVDIVTSKEKEFSPEKLEICRPILEKLGFKYVGP